MKSTIVVTLLYLLMYSMGAGVARADVCITNKLTRETQVDLKCGISNLNFVSSYEYVAPGKKICKKNKVLFIPTPCVAKVRDEYGGIQLTLLPYVHVPVSNLDGRSLTSTTCTIGPTYKSHTIKEGFLVPRQQSNILGKCKTSN
jgi:hypothetical protein